MPAFPLTGFLAGLGLSAIAVVVLLGAVLLVAPARKRHTVTDAAWGFGFVVIAVLTFLMSADDVDDGRRGLMLILTALWGFG